MTLKKMTTMTLLGLACISAYAKNLPVVDVYETTSCPCCKEWDAHMRQNGFEVRSHYVNDPSIKRAEYGMPHRYGSCHTARIDGYTIEGHVPASDIKQLLKTRPQAVGLSVPGMVQGSPGMESPNPQHYDTLLIQSDGTAQSFARH